MRVRKRTYVLVVLISIFVFAGCILNTINELTSEWAAVQKSTITNGEIVLYSALMLVGSVLLAAVIGLIICIPIKLLFGRDGKGANKPSPIRRVKKIKDVNSLTGEQVLCRAIATVGLLLAVIAFLLSTGIEYAVLGTDMFNATVNGEVGTTLLNAYLETEGIDGKWGILVELLMAVEQGEPISLWSFLAPDKTMVLGILAIAISAIQLKWDCDMAKMNYTVIVIAVFALVLNRFCSPWIQFLGGVLYYTLWVAAVSWIEGVYQMMCYVKDYVAEIYSTFMTEGFMEQKYIDTIP